MLCASSERDGGENSYLSVASGGQAVKLARRVDRREHNTRSQALPASSRLTARITPLPPWGDPAKVCGRGQTAAVGGPGTPDTRADDRPGRRAGNITTGREGRMG